MTKAYDRLKALLEELFQFDREDLDFGIYRIMKQKRAEVSKFLDEDLLPQVKQAFAEYRGEEEESARGDLEKLAKTLGDAGVSAESSPKYVALREKLAEAEDVGALENEVYSDLYTFFRRYYKNGDFLSLRRYKAGVYALPYEGEEVKLHWANADQYYVKTAENFRNYRFGLGDGGHVGFELVSAETERDNNKAANGKERRFVLREENPVEERDGELRVSFEYRPHPDKQADLNARAAQAILERAPGEWRARLAELAPTESRPDRTLLEKHLNEYTARNTFDYFVHKDLGGFLNRELDFFLKNEVLHVDDLDTGDERRVGQYLSKLRVIKRIGRKIVAFLAQIEDFQKKLFLKKKFVVGSGYCLTLNNVPEALYAEIAANDAQYDEWEKLFSISGIEANLENGGADDAQRTVAWLKANPYLVIDTKFFDADFKDRLLASIEDLDEKTDGLLVESENFQALNLLQARYRERVKCIYIDPPYNTAATEILYMNNYKHSSWLTLVENRIALGKRLLVADEGTLCITIDDVEFHGLWYALINHFSVEDHLGTVQIRNNPQGRATLNGLRVNHEYALFFARDGEKGRVGRLKRADEKIARWDETDEDGSPYLWENFRKTGTDSQKADRPKQYYPIYVDDSSLRIPEMRWDAEQRDWEVLEESKPNETVLWPVDDNGTQRVWKWGHRRVLENPSHVKVEQNSGSQSQVYNRNYLNQEGALPSTWWDKPEYAAGSHGTNLLTTLFGTSRKFMFPKSIHAVEDCLRVSGATDTSFTLDYFAGSGTTGHAVINLNREDGGRRKYVLVEMGEYFDSVLKPRILKVVYSKDWKDGKPVSREGTSHILKYLRLESYEDTLNNLSLHRTEVQDGLISSNGPLREAYTLSYMMDMETKGSPSLLDLDAFEDPFSYTLDVARGDETRAETVDLVETFSYLLGLTVSRLYSADGFRVVEGTNPAGERVLVIWRNMKEKSDEDLDAFFGAQGFVERSFDRVYANGDNTLALGTGDGGPKVHLIEEEFRRLMFETEGA